MLQEHRRESASCATPLRFPQLLPSAGAVLPSLLLLEVRQTSVFLPTVLFSPQPQGTSDQEPDSIGNWSSQEANRLIRCGKRQKPESSKTYPRSLSESVD